MKQEKNNGVLTTETLRKAKIKLEDSVRIEGLLVSGYILNLWCDSKKFDDSKTYIGTSLSDMREIEVIK